MLSCAQAGRLMDRKGLATRSEYCCIQASKQYTQCVQRSRNATMVVVVILYKDAWKLSVASINGLVVTTWRGAVTVQYSTILVSEQPPKARLRRQTTWSMI